MGSLPPVPQFKTIMADLLPQHNLPALIANPSFIKIR